MLYRIIGEDQPLQCFGEGMLRDKGNGIRFKPDHAQAAALPQDQRKCGKTVIGKEEDLQLFEADDLIGYMVEQVVGKVEDLQRFGIQKKLFRESRELC